MPHRDRGHDQRAGPASAGRHRTVRRSGPVTASGRAINSVSTACGGPRRARRQQQRRLTGPVDTGHHRVQPGTAEQAHQQGFPQRAAAQPTHVEGVLAQPQQAVLEMQDVGIPAQHQVAICHQRPQHRQHDRGHQHHDHADGHAGGDTEPLRGIQPRLRDTRILQRRTDSRLIGQPECGHDHGQTGKLSGLYRNQDGCQRASTLPAGAASSAVPAASESASRMARNRGTCSACTASSANSASPRRLLPGADPQHGQPQQPVQQPGIGRNRPNPVARHRQHLALQHAGPQLHLPGSMR